MSSRPNEEGQDAARQRLARLAALKARALPQGLRGGSGWSDVIIVGSGLALAVGCALFPWYVFFNQEKFGVQAMNFTGNEAGNTMPSDLVYAPERVRRQLNPGEIPMLGLDLLSTGTLPGKDDPAGGSVPLSDQPFPGDRRKVAYSLVHVANGRAMIEDEDGLWVVQKGSRLPDASRVASIEKRDGVWVLVTDADRVIPMAR